MVLVCSILPITILKNGMRITTLSILAVYVDPSWITDSWLHSAGGIPFFIISLIFFLGPVLLVLSYLDKQGGKADRAIKPEGA